MRLLKIGILGIPTNRWEDALDVFDDIDVFCFDSEAEIQNEHIHYIKFDTKKKFSFLLIRIIFHFNYSSKGKLLYEMCLWMLRTLNGGLLKRIKTIKYDYIYSGYNDYDKSAFLTALLNPAHYTRAQKETRLHYDFFEKWALKNADRVILNDPLNRQLFEKKYGVDLFRGKKVLYDLDEDVRTKRLLNVIQHDEKLSVKDGRIHAVILAGRVLSDPNDKRSGGRLYYIDLIQNMTRAGIVVHLHTTRIIPLNSENPYERMENENPDFYIEGGLDFSEDPLSAYKILSRYDIGVCHAHLPNSEVTEFDKINIPHRYYEYHLAHVVPFDLRGGNLLLEKKAEKNHALIYDNYSQINLNDVKNIKWDTPVFSDYIKALYPVESIC